MNYLKIPDIVNNFYEYNTHANAPQNGRNRDRTMGYIHNILKSYNVEICRYNIYTGIYTIYNHTARGIGKRSMTTGRHVGTIKRFLESQNAVINIVNYTHCNYMNHRTNILNIHYDLIRREKIKEIKRVNNEHAIFPNEIINFIMVKYI